MENKENKTKWLHARLSEEEYNAIHKQFKKTTCRKLSEYVRKKLLDKRLTAYYRNQSLDDFMAELIRLRADLNAIGNNFNQAVRKLNSMQQNDLARDWIGAYETRVDNAFKEVEEINMHIRKFAEPDVELQ